MGLGVVTGGFVFGGEGLGVVTRGVVGRAVVVAGLHAGFEGFLAQHFGSLEFGVHSSSGGK